MKLLPHRYPFLMVDRIIEMDRDESGIGIKSVTINEPFFQGHFPQFPVMPGVLIIEGLAQTAGALCVHNFEHDYKPQLVYFMGIDRAKFRKPVLPGDQLHYHVQQDPQPRPRLALLRRGQGQRSGRGRSRGQRHVADPAMPGMMLARMAEGHVHPTAIVEAGARLGDGCARSAPFASSARTSRSATASSCVSHAVVAGRTTIGAAHAHIPVRLDRPPAAGPQVQGRVLDAGGRQPTA